MYKIEIHWNQCQGANEFGDLHYEWVWTKMEDGRRDDDCLFKTEQDAKDYLRSRWADYPYLKEAEEGNVRIVEADFEYAI